MLFTYGMKILRPANLPACWNSVSDAPSRLWCTRCCANLLLRRGEDSLALLAHCCSLLHSLLSAIRCHLARWDSAFDAHSRLVSDVRSRLYIYI